MFYVAAPALLSVSSAVGAILIVLRTR
jgi:hypothetical protein